MLLSVAWQVPARAGALSLLDKNRAVFGESSAVIVGSSMRGKIMWFVINLPVWHTRADLLKFCRLYLQRKQRPGAVQGPISPQVWKNHIGAKGKA